MSTCRQIVELGFPYQTSTPPKPLLLTVNPSPSAHKVWSLFTPHAGPLPISRLSLPETGRSGLAFNPGNSRGRNSLRDKTFTYVFIAYHCKLFLPCDRWPDHQGCQVAFPIKQQEKILMELSSREMPTARPPALTGSLQRGDIRSQTPRFGRSSSC